MELPLESVALYALKLAYESEGSSPILRDDPAMSDYQRDVFAFDLRKGDMGAIQDKIERCVALALDALAARKRSWAANCKSWPPVSAVHRPRNKCTRRC